VWTPWTTSDLLWKEEVLTWLMAPAAAPPEMNRELSEVFCTNYYLDCPSGGHADYSVEDRFVSFGW